MGMILAIDPGSTESGWVLYRPSDCTVIDSGVAENHDILPWIHHGQGADLLALEMAESFGQKVWSQVFTTVRWTGRFQQAWSDPDAVEFVTRSQVKHHLLHGRRAGNDTMIRQALIELLGEPGTKRKPGPTFGVKSHAWAALAVAVVAARRLGQIPAMPAPLFREKSTVDPFAELDV